MPGKKRNKLEKRFLYRGKRSKKKASKPAEWITFTKKRVAELSNPSKPPPHVYRDTRTPHLCLRVNPTAKTFYWEKTVRGSQKRVTIGRFPEINVEQARALAADIAADYVKGIDVQESRSAASEELTLGDLWHDYRENRKRRIPGQYSSSLDYQWKRYFEKWKDKRLSDITYARARRMILEIRKRAPFHANRIQRHGQAMFNHAKKELRWKGDNPFDFNMVSEKGRARKVRIRAHEMPQFMQGLEACSKSMRLIFLSSLYTGRRVGEVRAMRWVDLDLDSAIWSIPNTKAGEPQEAVLPSALVKLLAQRRRKAKGTWVFPSPSKSGHVEEIKKAWKEVREASGLYHLQARDLRRTLASWAQDVNVPIAAVQAQLGHADYSTTSKYYTVISQTVQRVALDETVKSMIKAAAK